MSKIYTISQKIVLILVISLLPMLVNASAIETETFQLIKLELWNVGIEVTQEQDVVLGEHQAEVTELPEELIKAIIL